MPLSDSFPDPESHQRTVLFNVRQVDEASHFVAVVRIYNSGTVALKVEGFSSSEPVHLRSSRMHEIDPGGFRDFPIRFDANLMRNSGAIVQFSGTVPKPFSTYVLIRV